MRAEPISNNKTCEKHPHSLWESHCSVCLWEKKNKAEDSKSFTDMFLDAHGMAPKKEERIEEMRLRQKPPMAPASWKVEARTKALELACGLYNTPYYDRNNSIVKVAQRFYTYITKGE